MRKRTQLIQSIALAFLVYLLCNSPGLAVSPNLRESPSHQFLTLPFSADPAMQIQQGWKYTWDSSAATHKAIDYIKGTGADSSTWQSFDVLAAADGRACKDSNFEDEWGNYIRMGHRIDDTVYETYYGHLESIESSITVTCAKRSTAGILKEGIPVARGAKIGIAGTSGTSAGTHLHFQLTSGGLPGGSKVDPYALEKERRDYPDPNGTNGKKAGANHYWTTNPPTYFDASIPGPTADALLVSQSSLLLLEPGENSTIHFDVQNTGEITWTARQEFLLENINAETLGAPPAYALQNEVRPGQVTRWEISITAPEELGGYNTEWQMTHDGVPFGPVMSCLVIVIAMPEGDINVNPITLLVEWFNDLKERILTEINTFLENLKRQLEELVRHELERLWREFWENLFRQLCGASAIAPAVLLFGAWSINCKRRGRVRHNDRDD